METCCVFGSFVLFMFVEFCLPRSVSYWWISEDLSVKHLIWQRKGVDSILKIPFPDLSFVFQKILFIYIKRNHLIKYSEKSYYSYYYSLIASPEVALNCIGELLSGIPSLISPKITFAVAVPMNISGLLQMILFSGITKVFFFS